MWRVVSPLDGRFKCIRVHHPTGEAALRSLLLFVAAVVSAACASKPAPATSDEPAPARPAQTTRVVRETVTVRDPEVERRLSRSELRVIEKEAQVAELQTRLEDARDEV